MQFSYKEVIWRSIGYPCPIILNTCVPDALCGWTHLSPAVFGVKTVETCKETRKRDIILENLLAWTQLQKEQNQTRWQIRHRPNNAETPYRAGMSRWCNGWCSICYERCHSNCCNDLGSKQCILDILNHSYCVIQSRTNMSLSVCHRKMNYMIPRQTSRLIIY